MKREWKRRLQAALEAPPLDKQAKARFLRAFPQERISIPQFVCSQIAYMRKGTLLLSVLLLLPALLGAVSVNAHTLWIASALAPFLGLLAVCECTRSAKYGMGELEMSTRFSLKSVVLARMSILGLMDFLILCVMTPLCRIGHESLLLHTGFYLFVPYLLTVNLCLGFTRRFHGGGNVYGCMAIAVLVGGANGMLRDLNAPIYHEAAGGWWVLAAVVLLGGLMREMNRVITQTEEWAWS